MSSTEPPRDPRNPYASQPYPPPGQPGPYTQYPPYPAQQPTNGKAIGSLVTGIVSLIVPFVGIVTGPVAVVLAVKGRGEIRRTGQRGDGMAIAGLVTGILGCIGYAIFVVLLIVGLAVGD
ncbi:DUF4190 domain-containing protein [Streptomyces griseosporeus]|jgi:hypothetical protein|uniref:DUF4190 domain-containing protein n=1 Tax=Streptomyces griseosporeus TaxID=1910 RepID=UPI00368BC446